MSAPTPHPECPIGTSAEHGTHAFEYMHARVWNLTVTGSCAGWLEPVPGGPLRAGDAVRVVAETLANGAPHPYHGQTGVVLEVRDVGLNFPVRVEIAGRAVMFARKELARAGDDVGRSREGDSSERDSVSPVSLRQIDA